MEYNTRNINVLVNYFERFDVNVNICVNFIANSNVTNNSVSVAAVMVLVRNVYLVVKNHVCRLRCYENNMPSDGVRIMSRSIIVLTLWRHASLARFRWML